MIADVGQMNRSPRSMLQYIQSAMNLLPPSTIPRNNLRCGPSSKSPTYRSVEKSRPKINTRLLG